MAKSLVYIRLTSGQERTAKERIAWCASQEEKAECGEGPAGPVGRGGLKALASGFMRKAATHASCAITGQYLDAHPCYEVLIFYTPPRIHSSVIRWYQTTWRLWS